MRGLLADGYRTCFGFKIKIKKKKDEKERKKSDDGMNQAKNSQTKEVINFGRKL